MSNPEKFEPKTESREKKEIEEIEKSPLDVGDKRDLALHCFGEKPAALLTVGQFLERTVWDKKDNIPEEIVQDKEVVEKILDELGFFYQTKKIKSGPEEKIYFVGYDIFVSKNSENLNRLVKAFDGENEQEIGFALGYPETAVKAFPARDPDYKGFYEGCLDYRELYGILPKYERDELLKEGVFKFLNFKLSKNHWREELEVARKYQRLIKEKAPNLYKEILEKGVDPVGCEWKELEE